MIHKLLTTLLPLLLPLACYYIYFIYVNRLAHKKHIELHKAFLKTAPFLLLAMIGLVLMGITLGIWGVTSGSKPGEKYIPPSFENDRIKPGGFNKTYPEYLK